MGCLVTSLRGLEMMYLQGLMQRPVQRQSSIKDDGWVSNTLVRGVCYFTNTLNNLGSHAQVFRLCTHWMGDTPCS